MDADRIVQQTQNAPNLAAFLATIRACEGTNGPNGYRALFGYRAAADAPVFSDFAQHPDQRFSFRQTDGTLGFTTAAGAYQIIFATWDRLRLALALPNFSPPSQDAAATQLIRERKALDAVYAGDTATAFGRCWPVWASLPGSTYAQPVRSLAFAQQAFADAGGVPA